MDELKQIVQPGRLDQLAVSAARLFVGQLERACGIEVWDKGVGDIVQAAVAESSLPKTPVGPVDVARFLGILAPAPGALVNGARPGRRPRRRAA